MGLIFSAAYAGNLLFFMLWFVTLWVLGCAAQAFSPGHGLVRLSTVLALVGSVERRVPAALRGWCGLSGARVKHDSRDSRLPVGRGREAEHDNAAAAPAPAGDGAGGNRAPVRRLDLERLSPQRRAVLVQRSAALRPDTAKEAR